VIRAGPQLQCSGMVWEQGPAGIISTGANEQFAVVQGFNFTWGHLKMVRIGTGRQQAGHLRFLIQHGHQTGQWRQRDSNFSRPSSHWHEQYDCRRQQLSEYESLVHKAGMLPLGRVARNLIVVYFLLPLDN